MITIYGLSGVDGVIRYVGLTRDVRRRFYQYQKGHGHTPHLRNWLHSVGGALQFHTLVVTPLDLGDSAERWWISFLRERGNPLINYTTGGEGNCSPTAEVRAKVRAAQRERLKQGTHNFTRPDVRARVRAASQARRGKPAPWAVDSFRSLNKARTGIPLSLEHRQRVSAALTGRKDWLTPEGRVKVREAAKQRWRDPQYRSRMTANLRQSPAVAASRKKAIAASAEKRRGVPLTREHRQKVSVALKGRRNAGLTAYWEERKQVGTVK